MLFLFELIILTINQSKKLDMIVEAESMDFCFLVYIISIFSY